MVFSADQNVVDCFYPTALDETQEMLTASWDWCHL